MNGSHNSKEVSDGLFMGYHAYGVVSDLDGLVAVRLRKREAVNYVRSRHQRAAEQGAPGDCRVHPVQVKIGEAIDLGQYEVRETVGATGKTTSKVFPVGEQGGNLLLHFDDRAEPGAEPSEEV